MSNNINNNNINNSNNNVVLTVDSSKMELLKQFMSQNQISENDLKQLMKKQKTNFNFIDEAKGIATCNACGNEFNTNDIPDIHQERCKKSGICPDCAAQFAKTEALQNILKSKNIKNGKIVINGGKNVGQRLKQMFADAITSENFTDEIFAKFLDIDYSNKTLKFASYPLLVDITEMTSDDLQENKDYLKRFYARPYTVLNRKVRLCAQIYDAQLTACQKEFKNLGLIDEEANY